MRIRRIVLLAVIGSAMAAGGIPAGADVSAAVEGIDVSRHQGAIDWAAVSDAGIQFAYIKATEGSTYRDPNFNTNYPAAHRAGLIRGAYHFGRPDGQSGAIQAGYFVDHGGAWSADGQTLPGVLDIEYNPSSSGNDCYDRTHSQMVAWINDFITTYHSRTSRWPVIYTTRNWWQMCTGDYAGFADRSPLWIARYGATPGTLPGDWAYHTFWQYTESGSVAGVRGNVDRNTFNGSRERLIALADNNTEGV